MIASIKNFFSQLIEPGMARPGGEAHALQLATAALLVEMMRMDKHIAVAEQAAITAALQQQFGLGAAELASLVALAEAESRQASDYYQFTSLINQACRYEQKLQIIENLWRVALADGHLDAHELHLMRKLADLLHVKHGDYIAAKQRARAASGVLPEGMPPAGG